MTLVIRKCTILELENAPHILGLLEDYAAESSIQGLPHPAAKVKTYKDLEAKGALDVLGAFVDDVLVGFITVLCSVLPHYSVCVAVTESFFVLKEHRATGAGLGLLRAAEKNAKEKAAHGLLVSTNVGSNLAEMIPKVGYRETNRIFFKSFANE